MDRKKTDASGAFAVLSRATWHPECKECREDALPLLAPHAPASAKRKRRSGAARRSVGWMVAWAMLGALCVVAGVAVAAAVLWWGGGAVGGRAGVEGSVAMVWRGLELRGGAGRGLAGGEEEASREEWEEEWEREWEAGGPSKVEDVPVDLW